jgi:hypothetical protein
MTFLDQEISFDIGHLVLLLALVGFIFLVVRRCKSEGLIVAGKGGIEIQPVNWKSCRCPSCEEAALDMARKGQLYGCDPNNPFVPFSNEECNYQYRKAALHGCGVA